MKELSPLFEGIEPEEIKKLNICLRAKKQKFESGSEIINYGSRFEIFGVVNEGKVIIKKINPNGNSTILEQIERGGIFSNIFAFTDTDANYITAVAGGNVVITFYDYPSLFKRCESACEYHSKFVMNLLKTVADKTKTLSQRVQILSNKTIREKILSYASIAVSKNKSDTFTLPMTLTSFAEYLCVDRSAMMRELKKLCEEEVLKTNKRVITVLKKEYI